MRYWLVVLIALLLVPLTSGQITPEFSETVTASATWQIPTREINQETEQLADCQEKQITQQANKLIFQDEAAAQQCALVTIPYQPIQVGKIQLWFDADRTITKTTPLNTPINAHQELYLLDQQQKPLKKWQIFAPEQGTQNKYTVTINHTFTDTEQYYWAWWFYDEGYQPIDTLSLLDYGISYHATLSNIILQTSNIKLATQQLEKTTSQHTETGQNITQIASKFTLPKQLDEAITIITITTPSQYQLTHIVTPQQTTITDVWDLDLLNDKHQHQLSAQVTNQHGAGDYFTYYEYREPLPIIPIQLPVLTYWIPAAIFTLPILTSGLALWGILRHDIPSNNRSARETRKKTILAHALLALYYIVLLLVTLLGVDKTAIAQIPITITAIIIYSQIAIITISYVIIWWLTDRRLYQQMQHDLNIHQVREYELTQSNQDLENFAYAASHDLQEPLRKIAGFSKLLRSEYGQQLDEEAKELLAHSERGAAKLQQLVQDALAFARLQQEQPELTSVNIRTVAKDAIDDLEPLIKENKAKVAITGTWPKQVRGNVNRLAQVYRNLITNAIKYSHPERKPRVLLTSNYEAGRYVFTITDNGRGIPQQHLENVFQVFNRGGANKSITGSGIGLAACKRIIEQHNGEIWIQSELGKSTTISFTLDVLKDG